MSIALGAGSGWGLADREALRGELVDVGLDLLARRLAGEPVEFARFSAAGPARGRPRAAAPPASPAAPPARIVVATTGHLYPCAPLVGEDRDGGREAALRIGHLRDGVDTILARSRAAPPACDSGMRCACAAYLETGDCATLGPDFTWFLQVCRDTGAAVARALADAERRVARGVEPSALRPEVVAPPDRRRVLRGILFGAGGLVLAGNVAYRFIKPRKCKKRRRDRRPCWTVSAGRSGVRR